MPRKKNDLLEVLEPIPQEQMEDQADMASAAGASGQEDISEILASMDGTTLGSDTLPESAPPADETPEDTPAPADTPNAAEDTEPDPPKPKRATRKKKTAPAVPVETSPPPAAPPEVLEPKPAPRPSSRRIPVDDSILTVDVRGEAETHESIEDTIWHEIHNAYRTHKILTGTLSGIEQTDSGKTLVVADYKHFRIIIPLKEMMISLGRSPSGEAYTDLVRRQNKILGNMLGAEIDFVVKGIDSKTRSVVASRKEAMLKKRQLFYLDTDASGRYRIYEGRVVQCRVIAVAEKVIRVEIFGVETSIMARDLAWDWIGDAHDRFSVGDQILVRVLDVKRDNIEDISIRADAKSVSDNTSQDNLRKCRVQSKYAGKVTDVHKGVVYVRLTNGVNAIAHSCYDRRMPGKKDDVSFAVTRIDQDRGVAVGIITRIIKQNL